MPVCFCCTCPVIFSLVHGSSGGLVLSVAILSGLGLQNGGETVCSAAHEEGCSQNCFLKEIQ